MSPRNDVPSGLMSPRTSGTLERCLPRTNVSSESWQLGILSAGLKSPRNSVTWNNVATPLTPSSQTEARTVDIYVLHDGGDRKYIPCRYLYDIVSA